MMSSSAPTGFTVLLSTSSKTIGVGMSMLSNCNTYKVDMGIILIVDPKLSNAFPMEILLIDTVKIGFPGFANLGSIG